MRKKLLVLFAALSLIGTLGHFAADKPKDGGGKVEPLLKEMDEAYSKKDYAKVRDAGVKYLEQIQKAGKEADIKKDFFLVMGNCYYNLKEYDQAIASFDKAYERDMFDPQVLELKVTCYHDMKLPDKEADTLKSILQIDPAKKDIKYKLARVLEEQKKVDEALPIYEEIAKEDPGYNEVAFDVGVLLFQKGDYAKSLEYLDMANAKTPGKEHILLARGQSLLKSQKYKEAIPAIQDYLKVATNPDKKFAATKQLGLCQMKEKLYKEAIATYDVALQQKATDETSLLNKAQCQIELKENTAAISTLEAYMGVSKNEEKKKEVDKTIKELKGIGGKKK
jgi:tetratricopeptide (TPR) repeat protein